MSDVVTATEDRTTWLVDGQDRVFTFLDSYDRGQLLRDDLKDRKDAWENRRLRVISNLQLAEIKGEALFRELEAYDDYEPRKVTEQDWVDFASDPLNDVAIFERSLAKTYLADAPEIAKKVRVPVTELLAFKAKLCGLVVMTGSPTTAGEADGEPPDPNLSPPAAYGTPAKN